MATHSLFSNACCTLLLSGLLLSGLVIGACTDDPRYVQPAQALEGGAADADPELPTSAQIILPIRLETEEEAMERADLAAILGVDVPFVGIDDFDLSLEWTIRNLDDSDATVRILLNGANEYFAYVPIGFVIDPEEEPTPPPLAGDIPIQIPALGSVSGVFREDQIRELSTDLELITRGELNPFSAVLLDHRDLTELTPAGGPIPIVALASVIRFDINLTTNKHVVMEYAVRIRSRRSPALLHLEGLNAMMGELTGFAPADFVPPPAPADL